MKTKRFYQPLFLLALLLVAAGSAFISCEREKKCTLWQNGSYVYLNKPFQVKNKERSYTIKALFIPEQGNLDMDSLVQVMLNTNYLASHQEVIFFIHGNIPRDFRSNPDAPIRVRCSLQGQYKYHSYPQLVDKINCIEKY